MNMIHKSIAAITVGLASFGFLAKLQATDGYSTDFSSPPYQVGQTIDQVDGWSTTTITSGNLNDARIIDAPWGGTALYLKSSQTFGNPGTVSVQHQFGGQPITGAKIAIEAVVAFDIWSPSTNTNVNSTFSFGSSTPITFGFSQQQDAGLHFSGADGRVIILNKMDVKPHSPYTFSIVLDYELNAFDLTVTGLKKDDQAFEFTVSGVAFQNSGTEIKLISMTQNSTVLSGYLGSISVQPIPEASTVALFSLGGLGLLWTGIRRNSAMK